MPVPHCGSQRYLALTKILKVPKVLSELKLRNSANYIKSAEQSDSITLGTLAHFRHFELVQFAGNQPLSGANQGLVLWARILYLVYIRIVFILQIYFFLLTQMYLLFTFPWLLF